MEFKQFDTNFNRFKYVIEDIGIRLIKERIASSSDIFVTLKTWAQKSSLKDYESYFD